MSHHRYMNPQQSYHTPMPSLQPPGGFTHACMMLNWALGGRQQDSGWNTIVPPCWIWSLPWQEVAKIRHLLCWSQRRQDPAWNQENSSQDKLVSVFKLSTWSHCMRLNEGPRSKAWAQHKSFTILITTCKHPHPKMAPILMTLLLWRT